MKGLARGLLLGSFPLLCCGAGQVVAYLLYGYQDSAGGTWRLFGALGGLVPFLAALLLPLVGGWLKERAEGAVSALVVFALLVLGFPCGAVVVLALGLHDAAVESAAGGVVRGVALGLLALLEVAALVLYARWIVRE